MVNHDGLDSLLSVKKALEAKIEEALNAVAVLRKKHDAITSAIDVLRSSDTEIMALPAKPLRPVPLKMNYGVVEDFILDLLTGGPKSKREMENSLHEAGHFFTDSGIRRILGTCPKLNRTGERQDTRYSLRG